ncbi:MAG: CopD family protein, partial [Amaricoccus sp.]
RWLTAPSVAIHAAAFVFWIGALPGLAARAARPGPALVPTLRRFSALAVPLVALLVLSGGVLAVVQVRTPAALVGTAYGRLLLVKLAAVALLLGLAGLNRLWLTPAIERGETGSARRFRRSVGTEILIGLAILCLASGFRLTPPPRAIEAAASTAYVHLHGQAVMADVTLHPGRPGANRVEIVLMSTDGGAVDPLEVRIAFSDPARGIEPIRADATRDSAGWAAGPVTLPAGGHWTVRLDVLVSDFAKDAIEADLTLPGE